MKKILLLSMLLALLVPSWLMAQKPIVRPTAKLPVSTLPTRNVQNTQEVIYAVAGEKKSYSRTAEGWTLNSSTGAVSWATKTDETHIVFDGDDVYIKNPFSTFLTLTWIKGTRNGNTITFPGKQAILQQTHNEITYTYYAEKLRFDGQSAYLPTEGDITMTIDENNIIRYVGAAENTAGYNDIIGLSDGQGGWYGYGDMTATFTPIPQEAATVIPTHVTLDTYKLSYQGLTKVVYVGIDGADIYVTNLPDVSASLVLKGTLLANGDIEIPSGQYMGYNDIKGYDTYFLVFNSQTQASLDKATFTYNASAGTYTANNQIIAFNTNRSYLEAMFHTQNPVLERWEAEVITPADPSIDYLETATEVYNYNGMIVTIPSHGVNGEFLDTDNLYYNILIDGEVLTLTQDVYKNLPELSMTNIPYNYTDGLDIQFYSQDSRLFFFFVNDFETVGIQSLYVADGITSKSNIATKQRPPSAIDEITISKPVGEAEYYDLFGRKLAAPQKGINIEKYPDGTTRKIIYNE